MKTVLAAAALIISSSAIAKVDFPPSIERVFSTGTTPADQVDPISSHLSRPTLHWTSLILEETAEQGAQLKTNVLLLADRALAAD